MQRVPQGQDHIVEHNLILVHAAYDVHHDVALALVQHDPVVVEDDVGGLLGRLLDQAFLECFLGFYVWVGRLGCWCVCELWLAGEGEGPGELWEGRADLCVWLLRCDAVCCSILRRRGSRHRNLGLGSR